MPACPPGTKKNKMETEPNTVTHTQKINLKKNGKKETDKRKTTIMEPTNKS